MDGQRFDAIARGFSARVTRRRLVTGLLALGATSVGAIEAGAAGRRCRLATDKCARASQCCSGICDQRRTIPRSRRNRCICPANLTACKGHCKDVQTDTANCGRCGNVCPRGAVCRNGDCECPGDNQAVCDGACRDLGTMSDCSACGEACAEGASCTGNGCECPGDPSGVCSNVCTDFGTLTNCTGCGDVCQTEETCYASPVGCCTPSCAFKLADETDGCTSTNCPNPCLGVPTQLDPAFTYVTASGKQVKAGNTNVFLYNHPEGGNTNLGELTACTKDADCTNCPTALGVFGGGPPVDCGCDSFQCQFPAVAGKTSFQGYCTTYHSYQ